MAHMNQELKKELAPAIMAACKKHGVKATLSVKHYMALHITIREGVIDFGGTDMDVNEYHYKNHYADNPEALAFFNDLMPAMNALNYDNSDVQVDYFDVGYYVRVRIGSYDKHYIVKD
tara:strand:- start:154 stop:507 length:354 start_codon:yes stop_codon:yes gene_type:complete